MGFRTWVHLDYVADHHFTGSLKDEFYEKIRYHEMEKELFHLKETLKEKPVLYGRIMMKVEKREVAWKGNDKD